MRRLSDKEMAQVCGGKLACTSSAYHVHNKDDEGSAKAEPFLFGGTRQPTPCRFDLVQQGNSFAKPPKHLHTNHKSQNKVGIQSCKSVYLNR
jgi:hypothetical protein